jgi:hypothetical protein
MKCLEDVRPRTRPVRVRCDLVYTRLHRYGLRNFPVAPIISAAAETDRFLNDFQAINCLATFISSLRDSRPR